VGLSLLFLIFIIGTMSRMGGIIVSPLSVAFSAFILLLEVLVAFIQAYVFTFLSALYFGMATEEAAEHH
jgi:F-type H+-transporting ATPase subunit a